MALLNECAVCRYGYCVLIVARRHLVHMSVWSGSSLPVHFPAHRWQLKGRVGSHAPQLTSLMRLRVVSFPAAPS